MALDPYDVLGIAAGASLADARAAYRRVAALFHPDHLQGMRPDVRAEGERRLREANDALEAIRAGYRSRTASEYAGASNGLFGLFGTRKAGRPSDFAVADPDLQRYNAQIRDSRPGGIHADWTGRHAAGMWSTLQRSHMSDGAVSQVEWGAYETVMPGHDVLRLLGVALPVGFDWRREPIESFDLDGRRLVGSSCADGPGSRDLGWLSEQVDGQYSYVVTAEVF